MLQYRSLTETLTDVVSPVTDTVSDLVSNSELAEQAIRAGNNVYGAASYLGMLDYFEPDAPGVKAPSASGMTTIPSMPNFHAQLEGDGNHSEKSTPLSTPQDVEDAKGGPSAARYGATLKSGDIVVGRSKAFELGPFKGTGAVAGNLREGQIGGTLGLEADTGKGKAAATVKAGVDLASDGSVEAASGAFQVGGGPVKLGASGGMASDTDVVQLPNGMVQVTWMDGYGLGVEGGMDALGLKGSVSEADVSSRTFASVPEAMAFVANLEANEPQKTHYTAADLASFAPGEKVTLNHHGDVGLSGSTTAAAGLGLGMGLQSDQNSSLEKLPNGNIRVKRESDWGLKGTGTVGSLAASVARSTGFGGKSHLDVEFDLEQPGVAVLFDEFQRTGRLPETLPEGVTTDGGKDVATRDWGTKSTMGFHSTEKKGGTELGTYREGDVSGPYAKATSSTVDTRQFFGNPVEIASEQHSLEIKGYADRQAEVTGVSEVSGRGARAMVEDLTSSDNAMEQMGAKYGDEGGDFRVETRYAPDTVEQLAQSACKQKVPELAVTPLQVLEAQQQPYFDEFAGMCQTVPDLNPMLDMVANAGRDGMEFIAQNVSGDQTFMTDRGKGAVDAVEAHDRIEHALSRLQYTDGVVDQAEVNLLLADIRGEIEALGRAQGGMPKEVVDETFQRLLGQHDRGLAMLAGQ